jgi:hypothetical protein
MSRRITRIEAIVFGDDLVPEGAGLGVVYDWDEIEAGTIGRRTDE